MTTCNVSRLPWPWLVLLALIAALATARPATAQHQHDTGAHTLQLDNGNKWSTDAPLRQGMGAIRDAVAADGQAIHTNRETAAQYSALAGKIDEQIARIIQECKLAPKADAQLHIVLAEIIAGSDLMKGNDQARRKEGALKVGDALGTYPQYFDHPGWRPLD